MSERVVRVKIQDIDSGRKRHLRSHEKKRLWRFFLKCLVEAGFSASPDYTHWLNEYVYEGWWPSYAEAERATEELARRITNAEEIEECRWEAV